MFVMCGIHSACITCTKHCVHLPYYLCVPNTVLEPDSQRILNQQRSAYIVSVAYMSVHSSTPDFLSYSSKIDIVNMTQVT